jgi:hypothetical protein
MKTIFFHRSVGHNLIEEGNLRSLVKAAGIAFDDYDNNTNLLTHADGTITKDSINIPGGNTNPDNYAMYFKQWDKLLNSYDSVLIKSCYPNSHIKDETQLEAIKQNYKDIFEAFRAHHKTLIILTSPPLRPLFTNQREAQLSNRLSEWLVKRTSDQLKVLDFHKLLSEETGRHTGTLRRSYRRLLPFDNHPNKKANKDLAPKVATFIYQATA